MSAGRDPRPAPLLLKNPKSRMTWFIQYPAPSSKFQVRRPLHRYYGQPGETVRRDHPHKDVPVLCGNGFGMFAGKRTSGSP